MKLLYSYPPIRVDGRKPFNDYLWPTESYVLGHEHRQFHSCWDLSIVSLSDGRHCLEGAVYLIRDDRDYWGLRNNFPTRREALRAACARLIRKMRGAQNWGSLHGGMTGKDLDFAIRWALQTCAKACGDPDPFEVKPLFQTELI